MTFDDLSFKTRDIILGVQAIAKFPNGYGASVIQGKFTLGGPEGLYELAVLKFYGEDYSLCYNTPITDDVLCHLSEADVMETLRKIKELPKAVAA